MAGRKRGGPNKSAFIRDELAKDASINHKGVNEAWKAAGHSGSITATLFYQVKKKVGRPSRGRRGPGRPPKQAAGDGYLSIEKQLDDLITSAQEMGDNRLADDLRVARRRASAKLV